MKVVIAGGGTAGHIFPALATAASLVREHGADVSFLGTSTGLEAGLVPREGFTFLPVHAVPLKRKMSLATLQAPIAFSHAVKECKPPVAGADVVLGMGGYVSAPAVAAALRTHVPVVLHEQNAIPGLANRLFARKATAVALAFEEAGGRFARSAKTVVTGNPVRSAIATVRSNRAELRAEALEVFGFDSNRRTVVVFGGSQGAVHVNKMAVQACASMSSRKDMQVLLLSGRANQDAVIAALSSEDLGTANTDALKVHPVAFLDRMELAYAVADLVVARAGATSIAEITAAGLASILIPYPHATAGHQDANARVLERAGAATVLEDSRLTASELASRTIALLENEAKRAAMAGASAKWGTPDAASALAALVARSAGAK